MVKMVTTARRANRRVRPRQQSAYSIASMASRHAFTAHEWHVVDVEDPSFRSVSMKYADLSGGFPPARTRTNRGRPVVQ